jgi:hypothetical protein
MQVKNLVDILVRNGFSKDGDAYHVPAATDCSVYIGLGEDALVIDRVNTIETSGEVAAVVTQRRERYACEVAEVRAVRVTPESSGPGYR